MKNKLTNLLYPPIIVTVNHAIQKKINDNCTSLKPEIIEDSVYTW